MRRWFFSIFFVTLLGLFLAASFEVVEAGETPRVSHEFSVEANEQQIELIEELWGQPMTRGEFYKKVFPKEYEGMPDEMKECLDNIPKHWPKKPTAQEISQAKEDTSSKSVSNTVKDGLRDIAVVNDSNIDENSGEIDFESLSEAVPSWLIMPLMGVESYLWMGDDEDGDLVDYAFEEETRTSSVEADGSYTAEESGYYTVTGFHYGEFPVAYRPPTYAVSTYAPEIWVNP